WSPRHGWAMNFPIEGYNECLITYVLAASSPTHPIPAAAYHEGWARGGRIRNGAHGPEPESGPRRQAHLELRHQGDARLGGPLFWSHYSFLGLDPRGLRDAYADYWRHNVRHTRINLQHCIDNPHGYRGYGPQCWGLTAGYSVGFYAAHRPGEDLGVISPTAALSSMPYTPRESLRALRHFHDDLGSWIFGPYGFYDGFSLHHRWCKPWYLAIDQGPIVVMLENHRTGLLWRLFMSCPEVQTGLDRLGFRR
ncbi:MAG: glucoamylase family protein, partial [Verrucomicrobiota bacterium]